MKLTEKQLKRIIKECVTEAYNDSELNEGLWGKVKGATNGVKQGISGEWNKFKRGVTDTGLNNEYKGQSAKDRFNAFKSNVSSFAKSGDKRQDLEKALATIQKLIDSNVLASKGVEHAQELMKCIRNSASGSRGGVQTQYNAKYGSSQENDTSNRMVAERINSIVKESIDRYL